MNAAALPLDRIGRGVATSVAIAAAGYLGFVVWAGGAEVAATMAAVGGVGIAAALALSLVNYGLRFLRWRLFLAALGHRLPPASSAVIYLSGFALTTTPGKAGELMRGVFLARHGVGFRATTAAFVGERLSDLVAVIAIALPGLALQPQGRPVAGLAIAAVAVLALVLSQGDRLRRIATAAGERSGRAMRAIGAIADLLVEVRRCHGAGPAAIATGLSLVAWAAEGLAFHLILGRLGLDIDLAAAMAIYALGLIAGALSLLPGGLGGTEAVMIALLVAGGVPEAQAVAATLTIRVTTLWFAVAIGVAAAGLGRGRLAPSAVEAA